MMMTPSAIAEETATFAAGCFWCIEKPFDHTEGVLSTTVGYIGGHVKNPTYGDVSAGGSGHIEAIQVTYDPSKVSYNKLLGIFWKNIDPTQANGQFCDHGSQYRSAIFFHNTQQHQQAKDALKEIEDSGILKTKIVTDLIPATVFYAAEKYHQDYYIKNPIRYKYYRYSCGRDKQLEEIWGKSK